MCFSLHNSFLCFLILSIHQEIGSLEEVVMFQNGINADGISALASAFSHNKGLRVRAYLCIVFSSLSLLNLLWLLCSFCCCLCTQGCLFFLSCLQVLDLNDNTFTATGGQAMAKVCIAYCVVSDDNLRFGASLHGPWQPAMWCIASWSMTTCDVVHRFMVHDNLRFGASLHGRWQPAMWCIASWTCFVLTINWSWMTFSYVFHFFLSFFFFFLFCLQVLPSLENLCTVNFDDCLVRSEGFVAMADAFKNGCQKLKVGHHLNFFLRFCRTWTKRYPITSQTRVKLVSRIYLRTIFTPRMVRRCIRLTRLTLVCEVIRYRLVQAWQNLKKRLRVGGLQSPFSISSSFVLLFILLRQPAIAFLYLILVHAPLHLTSFLCQSKNWNFILHITLSSGMAGRSICQV